MRAGWLACAALLACGCARTSYFPMEQGEAWTYSVRTGLGITSVEQVKVARAMSVAGTDGWELTGPLGTSRLAWKDGVLVGETFSNLRFDPAVPLLVSGGKPAERAWRGTISHLGQEWEAVGTLSQTKGKDTIGTKEVAVVRTELTLQLPDRKILVESTYTERLGLVRQRQETDGRFDVALEYLGGD